MKQTLESLECDFYAACDQVGMKPSDKEAVISLLAPLRDKNEVTRVHYLHSLRVALVARKIAKHVHSEERPLVFAGALHDIGKVQTPKEVLGKVGTWTAADQRAISRHVMDGYRMLIGRFNYSAEIMMWHHKFQENGYPKVMPAPINKYNHSTQLLIKECGRMLALADVYDALHRSNSKFKESGGLTGAEIKEKMLAFNPDRVTLVRSLYDAGVFVE